MLNELASLGCSVEQSLDETYMGNESFYESILRKLPRTMCLKRMRAALDARDAKALFEASHELKGLYATLGLMPLFTMCSEIVEITRIGGLDGVEERLDRLLTRHDEFVAVIGGHQPSA